MACFGGPVHCYRTMQDEEVVKLAKVGDTGATEAIIQRYKAFVEMKARSYFVAGADKDDVIQEGMIGLFKAIRDYQFDKQSAFRPFAELCVTRNIISAVKCATRLKHSPLNASLEISDDTPPLLEETAESAFPEIPRNFLTHHELLVLESYLDGKSYREIGIELRCQTKSIDNALQRIKKKISSLVR